MKNKHWKTGLVLLLAVSVFCCGCGFGKDKKKEEQGAESGILSEDSVIMRVGEKAVRYSEVRAYCYFLKCQYEGNFGKDLWKYPLSADTTIGDEAKQEVISMITQLKIISSAAEKQKISLSAEEKDEAVQNAAALMEKASPKEQKEYFLNQQELVEIYQENILANKMFYIATDDASTQVSDEEARQVSIQCLQVMTEGTDRNGTQISMDSATKKEALSRAKKLHNEAKRTDNFLSMAQTNSDSQTAEYTIGVDSEELESAVRNVALTLKTGELSDVIEGENGYYMVYCVNENDEDATYQRKEEIIQQRQTAMFMEKYGEWMKEQAVNISESFWDEFTI